MDFVFFVALSNLTNPCILSLYIASTQYTEYTISRTLVTVDRTGSTVIEFRGVQIYPNYGLLFGINILIPNLLKGYNLYTFIFNEDKTFTKTNIFPKMMILHPVQGAISMCTYNGGIQSYHRFIG